VINCNDGGSIATGFSGKNAKFYSYGSTRTPPLLHNNTIKKPEKHLSFILQLFPYLKAVLIPARVAYNHKG